MSDDLQRGRWVAANYTKPFRVCGRPITNVEMHALLQYQKQQLAERLERTGRCCDAGPTPTGDCRRAAGRCVFFQRAERLLWRLGRNK